MRCIPHDRIILVTGEQAEVIGIIDSPSRPLHSDYAILIKGTEETQIVSKDQIAERTLPFKSYALPCLLENFKNLRDSIRINLIAIAIIERGEMIGFIIKNLPETLPIQSQSQAAFTKVNFKLSTLQQWQAFDAVELIYMTKWTIGYFVPARHQNWLPIPLAEPEILEKLGTIEALEKLMSS